jgi:hypothetical protein
MFNAKTIEDAAKLPESFSSIAKAIVEHLQGKTMLDGTPFTFYRLTMFGNGTSTIEYIDGDNRLFGLPVGIGPAFWNRLT